MQIITLPFLLFVFTMKFKHLTLLLLALMFCQQHLAQDNQLVQSVRKTTHRVRLDTQSIYHKETGEKIPEKEVIAMIRANSRIYFEPVYNAEAQVVRRLYDPNDQDKVSRNDRKQRQPIPNKAFPKFIVTSMNQGKIDSEDLKGKLTILRFEMQAQGFTSKKEEVLELERKIKALNNPDAVQGIVIFEDTQEAIKLGYNTSETVFALVANGRNYFDMLGVVRIPSTFLIDREGKLIGQFSYPDDIDLEEYLN